MENQRRIASQEPRGVDAKRQIGRDPLFAIAGDGGIGVGVRPLGFHRLSSHRFAKLEAVLLARRMQRAKVFYRA
jgi:hypothetical protein